MDQAIPRAALAMMEVESIMAASFGENGKRCYKVRWRDSWVFEDHLVGCKELVDRFWKDQKEAEDLTIEVVDEDISTGAGIKRDCKGVPKKDMTVIVIGNKDQHHVNNGNVSDTVPSSSEIDNDWMLDSLATDEEAKENDTWFVTSQTKKIRPTGSKYSLTCHLCEDEFQLVAAFRRHYSEVHPGVKPFGCDMCWKRFDRKENLSRHVRIHTGDRRYICNFCGKAYTDPSGLKKHVISKHSSNKLHCEMCRAIFYSRELYNKHLEKHVTDYDAKRKNEEQEPGDPELAVESRKPLLENNTSQQDEDTTIEVLMEDTTEHHENETASCNIINETSVDEETELKEPIQNVVHQLHQYVDGQVVQYVQVAHGTTANHDQTPSLTESETLNTSSDTKPFLFSSENNARETFVIPISSPQILSLNSRAEDNAQVLPVQVTDSGRVLPVQVTGDQQTQIVTVPIVSTQAFVYTGTLPESQEQREEILPTES